MNRDLLSAGIEPGMSVLDLGRGIGDVSLLAANLSELGFSEGGPELLKLGSPVQKCVIPHRIDLATSGTVQ